MGIIVWGPTRPSQHETKLGMHLICINIWEIKNIKLQTKINDLDADWRLDPEADVCEKEGGGINDTQFVLLSWSYNTLSLGFKQLQINCFKGTSEEVRRGNPQNSLKLKPFTLLSDLNRFDPLRFSNLIHPCLVSSAVIVDWHIEYTYKNRCFPTHRKVSWLSKANTLSFEHSAD